MFFRNMGLEYIVKCLFLLLISCAVERVSPEMVAKCPPYWVHRGGTYDCYLFHSWSTRTWYDARTYCERENGNLVRIGTADMTGWLALQIVETGLVGDSSNFWIDAVRNATLDKWFWDSSGGEVDLNIIPLDSVQEGDYGTLTTSSTLQGHYSSSQYHFICHRNIDEPLFCDFEDGWHMTNDRCYATSSSVDSWTNAQITCLQIGGYLITVNEEQEQKYVYDETLRHHDNIWIGMTELNHANQWYWVGDNSSSYTDWNTNNSMPVSQGGYGSAVVDREDFSGRWNVESVTNQHNYVCEKDLGACVMGWELYQESCYYFNSLESDKVTWETAYELCGNISTHLVVIDSEDEDNFIRSRFVDQDHMWIGLSTNKSASRFEWVDGHVYLHDNFTRMKTEDEDAALALPDKRCVFTQMLDETMNWMPVDCTEVNKYICEVPKGTPVKMHVPPIDQYCPEGWQLDNDFCYYGSEEEVSWTTAENFCKTNGGHLASVNSWIEQDLIRGQIMGNSWIGLNDRKEDGTYLWSDGNKLVIQNWNDGEPSGGDENCIEMQLDTGRWNDLNCDVLQNYVCRRPFSETPLAPLTTTTVPPETTTCGFDWVEDLTSGICYRLREERLSFQDARLDCLEMPYSDGQSRPDLVTLNTAQEQLFVQTLIARAQLEDDAFSTGLRNSFTEGMHWVDNSPVAFLNFADGEPNGVGYEDCIEIINNDIYNWNDIECSSRRSFVCEKKGLNYVAPTAPSGGTEQCPVGWNYFNQHCYYVSGPSETVSWQEAHDKCSSMFGSTMLSITNSDENDFLLGLIQDGNDNLWIGLYADGPNGTFTQWQDGSALEYTNWYPGEPNNQDGKEPCAEMMKYYLNGGFGEWNDMLCDSKNRIGCKMVFKTCPQSWGLWNDKCYYISDNAQTWDVSLEQCKQVDGEATLLSWHSQEEVNHVIDITRETVNYVWLGLYRAGLEDSWRWVDGSETDYLNWRPGQPDKNDTELCALVATKRDDEDYGRADNYPCSDSWNYACEYFPTHRVGCESGWNAYDGWCYYISTDVFLAFNEAEQRCVDMGGHLASVHSQEENEFLASLMPDTMYDYWWIGLTDQDVNGRFLWTDNSEVIFTHFDTVYGYNTAPMCYSISTYLSGYFLWSEVECTTANLFYCKKAETITPIGPLTSGCETADDLYHEGSCYRKVSNPESFTTARDNCSVVVPNSHLVTIRDRLENAFLSAYFNQLGERAWIGLEEVYNADGSVEFKWIDGSDFTFSNWGDFEPVTQRGTCGSASGEPGRSGLWYISDCADTYPYFCEYDRVGYTTQVPPTTTLGPAYCAPGWSYNGGTSSCYKLMMYGELTQGLAELDCMQYGGHLVSINSEAEEQYIRKLPEFATFNDSTFWTGLVVAEGIGYTWLDGSPTEFLHWANDQPDSHLQRENCVTAYKDSLELSDTYCDAFFPYMCKAAQGMPASTPSPVTSSPDVPCPGSDGGDGWLLYNDHCYKVFSQVSESPVSWRDARKRCQSHGGELLSVVDDQENKFVMSKVYTLSDYSLWIGGYADYDRGFHWSDGETWNYVSWRGGEPNNYHDQEACVSMYPNMEGLWNDDNCGNTLGWMCKKPSGNTLPPPATTPAPQGHCPEGWTHAGSKCIKVELNGMPFDDARTACKGSGVNADLISIHSAEMQAFVTALLSPTKTSAWLGLRSNDVFFWVDQTAVDYSNWGPGEPNNNQESEECGEALWNDGSWNDVDCRSNKSSICMQNLDSSLSTHYPPVKCAAPYEHYVSYDGACYKAVIEPKLWEAAEEYCVNDGAHLASVEGVAENSFVYVLAVESDMRSGAWLGLNSIKDPDQYSWSDKYPVLYSNWGNSQPNVTDTTSRCVQLSTTDAGLWFSKPCNEAKPFLCKHSEGSLPTADPPVDGYCPSTYWLDFGGGHCYLVITSAYKTWNEANQACIQEGGFLVSIHSEAEMNLVIKATTNYGYNLWSGLIQQTNGYGWSDGSGLDFIHWAENEPNGDDEPCVEMYSDDRVWNDISCDATRGYVCKAAKTNGGSIGTSTNKPAQTTTPSGHTTTSGLSGGGIAGIVISCLVLVAVVGLVGYSYRNKFGLGYSGSEGSSSRTLETSDILHPSHGDPESPSASSAAENLS